VADLTLRPALPFGVPRAGRFGDQARAAGVRVRLLARHSLVLVQPMKGMQEATSAALDAAIGLRLPPVGRSATSGPLSLCWAGAGAWLTSGPSPDLAERLSSALGDAATVIDQGDGRCLFHVAGRDARRTLEKGTTLDLHPRAFAAGYCAATIVSHLPASIRQVSDEPAYEVVVARSSAGSFWHWLVESASEYGLELEPVDA
jgi:sarcosine oxidase subunit gamma